MVPPRLIRSAKSVAGRPGPGRPVRLRVAVDDGDRRARPGHRPGGGGCVPSWPAVPLVPGLLGRAALDGAVADAEDQDGERARGGPVVYLRGPDVAAAGHLLRRGRGSGTVRVDQP